MSWKCIVVILTIEVSDNYFLIYFSCQTCTFSGYQCWAEINWVLLENYWG